MFKKHKRLFITLIVLILFVLSALGVGLGHKLFTTLPNSLAVSTHTEKAPFMVAHRGLSSLYPQNSLPAVEASVEYGFDGCEFDIHTTKDGKWVVIHDDTVDDMTNGTGEVESFTFEEIRELTLDSGNGIENHESLTVPTLEEVLDILKDTDTIPVIEIKKCDVKHLPSLKEILDEYGLSEKSILISFEREYLEKYRELDERAEIMLLKGTPDNEDVDWCIEFNAGLDFGYYSLHKTHKTISYAKEKGVKLGAWTVDNTAYEDVMIMFGVEVITTNKLLPR